MHENQLKFENHARQAIENQFNDHVTNIDNYSRTNTVIKTDLANTTPKIVKYQTFKNHNTQTSLGGTYIQYLLSQTTNIVPTVHQMYNKDPLKTLSCGWSIADYTTGDTIDVFHTEDFQENISLEIAHSLGESLAKIHSVSPSVEIPPGIVRYNPTKKSFEQKSESWRSSISAIGQSRYNTFNQHHAQIDSGIPDKFYSLLCEHLQYIPEHPQYVLSNMDYRPGNFSYKNLQSQNTELQATGIFDWDRAAYGDWQYGLSVGEFFLLNTCQSETIRNKIQDKYRTAYFNNNTSEFIQKDKFDDDRYTAYIALQYLQQCRSFNYWYTNRSEGWKQSQEQLLRKHAHQLDSGTYL